MILSLFSSFTFSTKAMAAEVEPATQQQFTPEQMSQFTPEQLALFTPENITKLTPEQLALFTPAQLAQLQQASMLQQIALQQQSRQLIFIGDSRTVGMKSAVGKNNNIWSAKVGKGLSWMKSTGVPNVEADINANTDVVILMGVNDVRSLSYTKKYISFINEKATEWTALGANVYYVSVNPMAFETKKYSGITNEVIEKWNTKMQEGLIPQVRYIDTYSQLLGNVSSKDGIHYNKSSYKTLYSLINQGIINDKFMLQQAALQQAAMQQAAVEQAQLVGQVVVN